MSDDIFLAKRAEVLKKLSRAVFLRAGEIFDGGGESEDRADAKDLIRALARLLNDWGYGTEIGKALVAIYATPMEITINKETA